MSAIPSCHSLHAPDGAMTRSMTARVRVNFDIHPMNTLNDLNMTPSPTRAPIKMWTEGVPVEDEARRQLEKTAELPIVFKHIAVMPDVHVGIGATVGSVVPTLMGARSYIVRGLGNPESFEICSHGAGRVVSRTQAKKRFTVDDQIQATQGVEYRKDADVIDEIPMAYKNIDAVMAAQKDLVEVVYTPSCNRPDGYGQSKTHEDLESSNQ
jgi:RNA-splicing ligase RtcB